MSLRFRRSVRLAPGLRVNLGLRGPSLSVGPRGLGATIGPAGLTTHVGVPGTGLSWRETRPLASGPAPAPAAPAFPPGTHAVDERTIEASVRLSLDEHSWLVIHDRDDHPLDPHLDRLVRERAAPRLRRWLEETRDEIDGGFAALGTIHLGTPRPDTEHRLAPEPYTRPEPTPPPEPRGSGWDRVFPWRRRAREADHARDLAVFEQEHALWLGQRDAHDADWERRRRRTEDERRTSCDVMHELLEEALHAVPWPRETTVHFTVLPVLDALAAEVELPAFAHLPARGAGIAARGFKLNLHERSEAERHHAYVALAHGVLFRVAGEAFAALPSLARVTVSGAAPRPDPATGTTHDETLVSVRIPRAAWAGIDFANLAAVDPVAALARFELRSGFGPAGRMAAVEPFEG